jgi:hypothetical protein
VYNRFQKSFVPFIIFVMVGTRYFCTLKMSLLYVKKFMDPELDPEPEGKKPPDWRIRIGGSGSGLADPDWWIRIRHRKMAI